jgi:diguanylate cyclase (GGDEF)-like protein
MDFVACGAHHPDASATALGERRRVFLSASMTTQAFGQSEEGASLLPTLAERIERVTRIARRLFRVPIVLVSLMHEGRLKLHSAQGVPVNFLGAETPFDAATLDSDGPLVVADTLKDARFVNHPWVTGRPNVRFYAGTLILGPEDEVAGVLSVADRSPEALAEADLILLRDLAQMVESELRLLAIDHAHAEIAAEEANASQPRRSLIDTSTQLWNRHAMYALLDREFHRAKRAQEGVAVILGEIDNFDAIAKQHGTQTGGTVLQEVTHRIHAVVRRSDTVARFGPDEFLVFLGRCDMDNASVLAERMRQRIRKTPVATTAGPIAISMTFGIAAVGETTEWTPDTLVRRADEALAQAVNAGRDCVVARKL